MGSRSGIVLISALLTLGVPTPANANRGDCNAQLQGDSTLRKVILTEFVTRISPLKKVAEKRLIKKGLAVPNEDELEAEGYRILGGLKEAVLAGKGEFLVSWCRDFDQRSVLFLLLSEGRKSKVFNEALVLSFFQTLSKSDPTLILDTRGAPLTFAFEREFVKDESYRSFVNYYRESHIPEEAWFKIPEAERFENLLETVKTDSNYVETSLAPKVALGSISLESVHGKLLAEVKSRGYITEPKKLKEAATEIAKDAGRWHSFHFHIVFDLPLKEDQHFLHFWYQLNQYFFSRGVTISQFIEQIDDPRSDHFGRKMHAAGVRDTIYGASFTTASHRVGIELRDVIDSPEGFEELFQLVEAVKNRVWATRTKEQIESIPYFDFKLTSNKPFVKGRLLESMKARMSDPTLAENRKKSLRTLINEPETLKAILANLTDAHHHWALPYFFNMNENGLSFAFNDQFISRDGTSTASLPLTQAELDAELQYKKHYEQEIVDLILEIQGYREIGTSDLLELISKDTLRSALNMVIGTWAKRSHTRDLVRPF